MCLRKRTHYQCVIPTMTYYGAETRTITKHLEQKLMTEQRAMERRMLNMTMRDKIRNSEIRKQTKVKDVMLKVKDAKWRWAGHLIRREGNRWTKRLKEWQPRYWRRCRGRHKRRWRDDITSYTGNTWTRLAKDRRWRQNHEEGYTQQWIDRA